MSCHAALELNDQLLQIHAEDGSVHQQTGFARLSAHGIECGEVARASAWREPQNSYNQYWCHLNQTSLAGKQKWARHNADIAFAQLKHLWQEANEPESLLILVPGSFSHDQLSLLLGLVNALPSKAVAVIDSALSAGLGIHQETVFVDLQLHQTVVSLLRRDNQVIHIAEQEIIPDLGMMQILNRVSRHISNLLIQNFRHDPLHTSATEQIIYDQLPGWLGRLDWEQEISATLPSEQGDLAFILSKTDVQDLMRKRLGNLRSVIERHPGANLVLSHPSRLLTTLLDGFSKTEVATQSMAIENGLLHQQAILDQVAGLHRLVSLQVSETDSAPRETIAAAATHLLYGGRALPLSQPVSIRIADQGIELANRMDDKATLTVVVRNQNLELVHCETGTEPLMPKTSFAGESIVVGQHQFDLIEVADG